MIDVMNTKSNKEVTFKLPLKGDPKVLDLRQKIAKLKNNKT